MASDAMGSRIQPGVDRTESSNSDPGYSILLSAEEAKFDSMTHERFQRVEMMNAVAMCHGGLMSGGMP